MDAEIVLVTNLAYHPETALPVGLIVEGSKRNCIGGRHVDGAWLRVFLDLTLVDIECQKLIDTLFLIFQSFEQGLTESRNLR